MGEGSDKSRKRRESGKQRNRSIPIVTTDMMNDSQCVKKFTRYSVGFHKSPCSVAQFLFFPVKIICFELLPGSLFQLP